MANNSKAREQRELGKFALLTFTLVFLGLGLYAGFQILIEPTFVPAQISRPSAFEIQQATISGKSFIGLLMVPAIFMSLLIVMAIFRAFGQSASHHQVITKESKINEEQPKAKPVVQVKKVTSTEGAHKQEEIDAGRKAFEERVRKREQQDAYWKKKKEERDRRRAEEFEKRMANKQLPEGIKK